MTNKLEDTWDKDETISAETAAIYGLSEDYTPDKAFRAISTNFNRVINVTVTLDGSPIEGVTVLGITPLSGEGNCVTDSSGKPSGTPGVDTVTISTEEFIDVVGGKASKVVETGGALLTDITLEMTSASTFKKQYIASTYVVQNVATGGGGGYTKSGSINIVNRILSISVGSGGNSTTANFNLPDNNGGNGGTSSISSGGTAIYANGGNGGRGNRDDISAGLDGSNGGSGSGAAIAASNTIGAGNPGADGKNGQKMSNYNGGTGQGTTTRFDGITYSTAGGSAAYSNAPSRSETSGNGKIGAVGINGSQYGDGGGGCINTVDDPVTSGAGKQGCVWIYW